MILQDVRGANTAIFRVVKAVLLEPLAYREPRTGGDYPDLVAAPV